MTRIRTAAGSGGISGAAVIGGGFRWHEQEVIRDPTRGQLLPVVDVQQNPFTTREDRPEIIDDLCERT